MTPFKDWDLHRIEDPNPIQEPDYQGGAQWRAHRTFRLGSFSPPIKQDFSATVEKRRSCRNIGVLSVREIANVLGFALAPRFVRDNDLGHRHQSPTISAGALHSVEIIIVDWRGSKRALRYSRTDHSIDALKIEDTSALSRFVMHFQAVLDVKAATAIVLLGDIRRISAFYENAETLLSRDAGAILQSLSLCAAAYRIGFCPLGILGSEVVNALGMTTADVRPLGVAAIGSLLD